VDFAARENGLSTTIFIVLERCLYALLMITSNPNRPQRLCRRPRGSRSQAYRGLRGCCFDAHHVVVFFVPEVAHARGLKCARENRDMDVRTIFIDSRLKNIVTTQKRLELKLLKTP